MARLRLILIVCFASLSGWSHADSLSESTHRERLIAESGPSVLQIEPSVGDPEWAFRSEATDFLDQTSPLRQASMLQQTPLLRPRTVVTPEIGLTVAGPNVGASVSLTSRLFGSGVERSNLRRQAKRGVPSLSVDLVNGTEAAPLSTNDLGDLLKKSSSALSSEVQRRSPIINEARVRGSRIGTLAASGSHWIPARADIDTAVSKIDSRQIRDVILTPGPYSSVYGPGFHFLDFELETSPRFSGGRELHGLSTLEHKSNGNQYMGQQTFLVGDEDWGFRAAYSHRVGSNYRDGDGQSVASSYKSRALTMAAGRDFGDNRSVELSLLRLDQTDVELAGFVFDINTLVADGYEVTYFDDQSWIGDASETEIWYNRTDFDGDSRNPEKARQFPLLSFVNFDATTNADVMSTGYRRAFTWGKNPRCWRLTVGHDLRMIKQEINELFTTFLLNSATRISGQGPLPRSFSVNPGLFAEYTEPFCCDYTFQSGMRLDYMQTDITEDLSDLQDIGLGLNDYPAVMGTDLSQTDRFLGSLYARLERRHSRRLTTSVSLGFAERAPSLTELYGAEQLLLVVQNGLNTVTGDPRLKDEKILQFDLNMDYENDWAKFGMRGYHSWVFDYITFENTNVARFLGSVAQTSLRYVNTSLATLSGFESFFELMHQSPVSYFARARYRHGRDRTRNGDFATSAANNLLPSFRDPTLPRGAFSQIPGGDSEPLPSITPFELRTGIRLRDNADDPSVEVQLSARIVDNQDRVATSLLENETPGFTVWDLRTIWQPRQWEGVTFYSGIENLTDKAYREHLDFQSRSGVNVFQPGLNFYFGVDGAY